MKINLQYTSALAICKAEKDEIKVLSPLDPATGKYDGEVQVFLAKEWQTVFKIGPVYNTVEDSQIALYKFVDKIKNSTPWTGRHWPLEKGPAPYGFIITAGPNGERLLGRPKLKGKRKGPNFQKPRR